MAVVVGEPGKGAEEWAAALAPVLEAFASAPRAEKKPNTSKASRVIRLSVLSAVG